MKKLLFFLCVFPLSAQAQSDTTFVNEGTMISINEQGINDLVGKYETILKEKGGVDGWRVQLKFKLKEAEILQLKLKFIKLYPDIPVLLEYDEPYYRIRVGNCRTKLEAIKIKRQISKKFPGAYPVPEIINFSQLKK
jgi:hypothetical protein